MPAEDRVPAGAATLATSAPLWAWGLDQVNQILTTVSLLLGIAFLLWQWIRAARQNKPMED
ncbi:hypothetical protein [Phaeospirillum tilakii]|uniref:Phage holin T7 family, holin superfamily II n=1 Tax=Phaeospirillum tilakii TaxID=741673 RepID=A0ABW5CHK6_9PROT